MDAGYYGVSLGDIFRDFSRERHSDKPDPISVANMTETANWLRETRGADVALQEALRRYQAVEDQYKGLVLYSVRAPVEVDFILEHGGRLVWVESSDEVRHERMHRHRREGEVELSLEEFKAQEAKQWEPQPGIPPEAQMNIAYVRSKATDTLVNNSDDLEAFHDQAAALLQRLEA